MSKRKDTFVTEVVKHENRLLSISEVAFLAVVKT